MFLERIIFIVGFYTVRLADGAFQFGGCDLKSVIKALKELCQGWNLNFESLR